MRSELRQARRRHLRHRMLGGLLALSVLALLGRAFELQVLEGSRFRAQAVAQHEQSVPLPAPRGTIYDRDGRELAVSRTTYRLAVAPSELEDPAATAALLRRELSLPAGTSRQIAEHARRWVVLPGTYSAVVKERLEERLRTGLYPEPVVERFYPRGRLAGEVLGRVDATGRGASGLELALDSVLAGQPGFGVRRRDATGTSAAWLVTPMAEPAPGGDVYLTLDAELQALAESVLEDAIHESEAEGGDLLILRPESGELLAATSRRHGRRTHLAAATEPYEPGSTLKPFTAAALLVEGLAELDDSVDTAPGWYRSAGRTIHDVSSHGRLSLAGVLELSSNVGMAKFAERLPRGVQYSYLRDFGFGTLTGLLYPSESPGLLRPPGDWSRQSSASLAIGYEIAVTPLQLTLAFGALANGGRLMRPRLLRELQVSGRARRWVEPEVVRRVVPEEIAAQLREVLTHAVSQGTGRTAGVRGLSVAGKTGTALRFDARSGYSGEKYTASFVGLVPSEAPQLVILVKLDAPSGAYYGGQTAAPVMRTAVRAALAGSHWSAPPLLGEPDFPEQKAGIAAGQVPASGPFVFALDAPLLRAEPGGPERNRRAATVPDVRGASMRAAVHRLHEAGWRVVVQGGGRVVSTQPSAGSVFELGKRVVLEGGAHPPPPGG